MTDNLMDPVVTPAYLIRSYTWQLLKNNMPTVWDESKYGGMIPIVPLSEEPEISEYDGPHIVYGYAANQSGPLPARKYGSVSFAVYDQNFRRLSQTMTVLQAAFERKDEAARDVNAYTSRVSTEVSVNNVPETRYPFHGMRFGYIQIGFVEHGTPEETEGGRQSALININFEFYVDYDVSTNPAEWVL